MSLFYITPPLPPHRLGSAIVSSLTAAPFLAQVTDGVTLGEGVQHDLLLFPTITEGVTLGDTPVVAGLLLTLTVTEATTVGDLVVLLLPFLATALSESVTVGEALFFGTSIVVTEAVTVGETSVIAVPFLALLSVDALTMSDDPYILVVVVPIWPQHQLSQAVHRAAHW